MSFLLKLGFVGVAAATLVGADYYVQSQAAGVSPLKFGVAGYQVAVEERLEAVLNKPSANQVDLTSYLPAPWDGWAVDDWSPRRAKALATERQRLKDLGEFVDPTDEAIEAAFPEAWHSDPIGSKRGNTLIFTRGDELIEVTIKRNAKAQSRTKGASRQVNREGYEHVAFGNIHGVKFVESIAWSKGIRVGAGSNSFRSISGHVDGNVLVAVSAVASSSSIKKLLGKINFRQIEVTLRAERAQNGERVASKLPQVAEPTWENRTRVKRVQVNPKPHDREKPGFFMQIYAAIF